MVDGFQRIVGTATRSVVSPSESGRLNAVSQYCEVETRKWIKDVAVVREHVDGRSRVRFASGFAGQAVSIQVGLPDYSVRSRSHRVHVVGIASGMNSGKIVSGKSKGAGVGEIVWQVCGRLALHVVLRVAEIVAIEIASKCGVTDSDIPLVHT